MIDTKSKVLVDEDSVILDGSDVGNDSDEIRQPFDPSQVRVETRNSQIDALIKRMKYGEIELSPYFQRRSDVWQDDRQSRLIESMLVRIPLPAFYVDATDENKWLVVDGLQRLNAVKRFVIEESLVLTRLEFLPELNGKKFSELPRTFQRRIEETDIVLHKIQPGSPPEVKYTIFRRINTGGEPLKPQEIRRALNYGPIVQFLENMAGSKEFKEATANGVSPRRMDDQECVLRFLAFTIFPPENYRSDDFDMFLNNAMIAGNKFTEAEMQEYGRLFLRAMDVAAQIFGRDAFRKLRRERNGRFPINKALFEAVAVNIGELNTDEQDFLIKHRNEVISRLRDKITYDENFELSISQGTGSIRKVRYRFAVIKNIFMGVLYA